jgi:RND family efflux transporter MFP subunit
MNKSLSIAITTLALATFITGCKQKLETHDLHPVRVNMMEIKNASRDQQFSYSGTIEPENTALLSFAVPGVIETVAVDEGQLVKQGQILASIDDTEYRNALAIATAALTQAEDMYKRLNSLYLKGSLPEKDFIDIQTKVTQARANKEINAKHIRDSKLVAPFTGVITRRMIERGSTSAPGVPAFQIVKTDNVYARVAVPESEVGSLTKGMSSDVYIKTLDGTFHGKIWIINPQADPVAKTYETKIMLDNASRRLLPGMIANVTITTGKKVDFVTIPASAIIRGADDVSYVFISNNNNKAMRKRIEVKGITGQNEVIVTGLQAGDKVVIAGQTRLKEGTLLATL